MKLKINTKAFVQALNRAQKASATRTTLPLLSCALIEAKDGIVRVTGTDLDSRIETLVEAADVEIEREGAVCVSFNRLIAALRAPEALLESDKAKLSIDSGAKTTLGILDAGDFPPGKKFEETRPLDLAMLQSAIKQVSGVASTDPNRYTLNGVCLSWSEDYLHIVATDGRSMAYMELPDMDDWHGDSLIIPNSLIGMILSLPENKDAEWSVFNNSMEIRSGNTSLQGSLIEGMYPNWRQVIPNVEGNATINKDDLMEALNAVMPFCEGITNGTSMAILPEGDHWTLEGGSGLDTSRCEIPVQNQTYTKRFKLDPSVLKRLVSSWNADQIVVAKNDSDDSPLLFTAKETKLKGVAMPLRLQ